MPHYVARRLAVAEVALRATLAAKGEKPEHEKLCELRLDECGHTPLDLVLDITMFIPDLVAPHVAEVPYFAGRAAVGVVSDETMLVDVRAQSVRLNM